MTKATEADAATALLDTLERSKVLDAAQFSQAREAAAEGGDAKTIARRWVKLGLLTPWQAGQIVGNRTNLHIGKYRLLDLVGEVGIGKVHIARHVQMDRRVALKVLRKNLPPKAVESFLSTVRRIAGLDHPNVIRAFDIDRDDDGRYFLVLEYAPGRDLAQRVEKEGPLAPHKAAEHLRQAADGLGYLHENGVTHGDVKPANLLVDEEGQVKLLNVGMAQLAVAAAKDKGEPDPDASDAIMFELPPELAGDSNPGVRHDLYALGCTAFFLLSGHRPKRKPSEAAAELMKLRPDVSKELAQFCQRLIDVGGASSFGNAKEAAAALTTWLNAQQVARPAKAPPRIGEKNGEKPGQEDPSSKRGSDEAKRAAAAGPRRPAGKTPEIDAGAISISIQTNRPAKPAAPPAVAEAPAESEAATTPPAIPPDSPEAIPPAPPSAGLPLPLLIGGGIVAVLVLIGGGVGIGMMLSGGKPEVGQNTPAKPGDGKNPKPGKQTSPSPPGPMDTVGIKPMGEQPMVIVPPTPMPMPEPKPEPVNPPEVKPEPPVDPEPKPPVDPPAPEPKPEPTPPEPKPEPPMPAPADKPKALRDMPTLVPLPLPAAGGQPIQLGKVHLMPGDLKFVSLLGGEKANGKAKAPIVYALMAGNNGLSEKDWDIRAGKPGKLDAGGLATTEGPIIAKITLEGEDLKFNWSPEAVTDDNAGFLQNCILSLRMGGDEKRVSLRQTTNAPSIPLSLDKPNVKAEFKLDYLPDAAMVKLQVLPLEGAPKHRIEPALAPLEKSRPADPPPKIDVVFGEGEKELIKIQIEANAKGKVALLATPLYKVHAPDFGRFTQKNLNDAYNGIVQANASIQVQLDAFNKLPMDQKQRLETQKRQAEEQVKTNHQTIARLEQIKTEREALNNKATIRFRILYEIGEGQQVILAESGGGEAPAAGGPGPGPMGVPMINLGPEQGEDEPKTPPPKKKPTAPPKKAM